MSNTIGIWWMKEQLVPEEQKKWLRLTLRGFAYAGEKVASLHKTMGSFSLALVDISKKTRDLFYLGTHVAILVDNPDERSGLPSDVGPSSLDYVEGKIGKPERSSKEHPGFGWDPGYDD